MLAALGFPLGLLVIAAFLFCVRLDAGLRLQTRLGLTNLRQAIFAALQLGGTWV